jgi:hypothetical protein
VRSSVKQHVEKLNDFHDSLDERNVVYYMRNGLPIPKAALACIKKSADVWKFILLYDSADVHRNQLGNPIMVAKVTDVFIIIETIKNQSGKPMALVTNGSIVGWTPAYNVRLLK